jgi:hypothetical protein
VLGDGDGTGGDSGVGCQRGGGSYGLRGPGAG